MRIVVFSDSHNNFYALDGIVRAQPEASLFLHLGDGEREWNDLCCLYPDKRMYFVRGNCDWGSNAKTEAILFCEGKKVFFTHGHIYDVKYDLELLTRRAKSLGANIVCFGHTHTPVCLYSDGMYLINPGSVSISRAGTPSYGVVDITEAGIVLNTVYLVTGF